MKWRILLALLVGACFYHTYDRLKEFALDHLPVASVGECVDLSYKEFRARGMVVSNDIMAQKTVLEHDLGGFYIQQAYSFSDLRDLNAKKVGCDEAMD